MELPNHTKRPPLKIKRVDEARERAYLTFLEAILYDGAEYREILAQKGALAQSLLDLLQSLADHPSVTPPLKASIIQATIRLSRKSNMFPQCLAIHNIERSGRHPVAAGAFGDVWRGGWLPERDNVCLKMVRLYDAAQIEKALKSFLREAIIWQEFNHPNLLPFYGLYHLDGDERQLCLASPWMNKGNLSRFLETTPRSDVNHLRLVWDVANGLSYLHEMEIVHADLKGANILLNDSDRAVIADFGLSRVGDGEILRLTATATLPKGTTRWIAPEVLLKHGNNPTYQSDIYAFACVCYEIYTSRLPFHDLPYDAAVIIELSQGNRPKRPSQSESPQLSDEVWEIITECWSQEPSARPSAKEIRKRVEALSIPGIECPPNWDPQMFRQVQSNVQYNVDVYDDRELDEFLSVSYGRIVARYPGLPSRKVILSELARDFSVLPPLWLSEMAKDIDEQEDQTIIKLPESISMLPPTWRFEGDIPLLSGLTLGRQSEQVAGSSSSPEPMHLVSTSRKRARSPDSLYLPKRRLKTSSSSWEWDVTRPMQPKREQAESAKIGMSNITLLSQSGTPNEATSKGSTKHDSDDFSSSSFPGWKVITFQEHDPKPLMVGNLDPHLASRRPIAASLQSHRRAQNPFARSLETTAFRGGLAQPTANLQHPGSFLTSFPLLTNEFTNQIMDNVLYAPAQHDKPILPGPLPPPAYHLFGSSAAYSSDRSSSNSSHSTWDPWVYYGLDTEDDDATSTMAGYDGMSRFGCVDSTEANSD